MARGGLLSLARLITGIIRVKVVALALGAAGVGVYSLLLQLYLTGVALVSMSLALPIINLGRRPIVARDFDETGAIAGTALTFVIGNTAVLLLLFAAFERPLLAYLGLSGAGVPIWPILAAIVIGACSGAFWEGMSFLCDRFDTYVWVGVIGTIADCGLVVTGAWLHGLRGAVFAMPLSSFAMFLAYLVLMTRDAQARQVISCLRFRARILPRLLGYSAVMFATVGLTNVGLTAMRSRVLVDSGAAQNGYLQTVTSLAAYTLAFVTTGFWGHLHSKAAAEGDVPAVRAELRRALELGLLISFCGCGAGAVLADYLIPLFYSHAFDASADMVTAYMPGELCFQILSLITAYQLTVSLRRIYLLWNVSYVAGLVLLGTLLIPRLGAYGYIAAHLIAAPVVLIGAFFISWRRGQISAAFSAKVAALALLLAAICLVLLHARSLGGPGLPLLAALLLPFAAAGTLALRRLLAR